LDPRADLRTVSVMVDYVFGRGVSRALPKEGFRLFHSRRSGRVKLIVLDGKIFATVKPNGSLALSMFAAKILSRSPRFRENSVEVSEEAVPFVKGGRSVFCRFVTRAGKNIHPRGEVVVVDGTGQVLGVGTAVLNGTVMRQFKTGVAVKVRAGLPE
jgi:predicted RNA-binding protein (TIGR00451 family)